MSKPQIARVLRTKDGLYILRISPSGGPDLYKEFYDELLFESDDIPEARAIYDFLNRSKEHADS